MLNDWLLVAILIAATGLAGAYLLLRWFAHQFSMPPLKRPSPPRPIVSSRRAKQRLLTVTSRDDGRVLVDVTDDHTVWLSDTLTLEQAHQVVHDLVIAITRTYS